MKNEEKFETHITINAQCDLHKSVQWAEQNRLKLTHIVLSRGETVSQPMFTFHDYGTLNNQLCKARLLNEQLAMLGFETVRIKCETSADSQYAPQSNEVAYGLPEENYFEFHIKVAVPSDSDFAELTGIAENHSARLSRNAFRKLNTKMEQRFVTQRSRLGKPDAFAAFENLESDLKASEYSIVEVEQEFVVYDSNLTIDSGWLT